MSSTGIKLSPQIRGDTFKRITALGNGWTADQFTGGLRFTVRRQVAPSQVIHDREALAHVSTASGGIVATGTAVTITIPASVTRFWPLEELVWDLQGTINGAVPDVRTIAMGTVQVIGDVTRSS
jgi:hypothetical protein